MLYILSKPTKSILRTIAPSNFVPLFQIPKFYHYSFGSNNTIMNKAILCRPHKRSFVEVEVIISRVDGKKVIVHVLQF